MTGIYLISILFVGLSLSLLVLGDKTVDPMVAFTCNLPAVHLTKHGWKRDEAADCLTDPQQILDYCRQMYPDLDIRNIVESATHVRISDWCPAGRSRCHHHTFTVRPYRCLVGAFQSDALLVPRDCLFDHIHDPHTCQSFDAWNQSAVAACRGRGLEQHSFAIIQPCSVDRFSGAEFVCCPALTIYHTHTAEKNSEPDPRNKAEKVKAIELLAPPPTKELTYDVHAEKGFRNLYGEEDDLEFDMEMDKEKDERWGGERVDGAFVKYMREGVIKSDSNSSSPKSEYEAYRDAKLDLEKRHHQKVTKMKKEWSDANHRVEAMMSVDSKGADKLNKQITARFQKMYDSLEDEEQAESKRLAALHHQRVQAELNELKRSAMEAYMATLAESKPSSAHVLRALRRYLKLEQKDRVQMISHYQRTQEADPVQADNIFSYVADHLTVIDQRIAQALDMLHGLPDYQQKKIRSQIDDFMSGFHSMDDSLAVILAKMDERGGATTEHTARPPAAASTQVNEQITASTTKPITIKVATRTEREETVGPTVGTILHDVRNIDAMAKSQDVLKEGVSAKRRFDRFDDGVMESRDDYIEIRPAPGHASHLENSQLNLVQMRALRAGSKTDTAGMYLATPLGIAVCSIALIVIISVAIIVMRRRVGGGGPARDGGDLMSVATPPGLEYRGRASPLSPRQMNGYENPTHKYLEQQQQQGGEVDGEIGEEMNIEQ